MHDLRQQIKHYNQTVIDRSFPCQRDRCPNPRCKKTTSSGMMLPLVIFASDKAI
jgi:hypothetical protein